MNTISICFESLKHVYFQFFRQNTSQQASDHCGIISTQFIRKHDNTKQKLNSTRKPTNPAEIVLTVLNCIENVSMLD